MSVEPWLSLSEAFYGGNAVIIPERGDDYYFTLIGGGSIKNQNMVARRIVEAANSHERLRALLRLARNRIDYLTTIADERHYKTSNDLVSKIDAALTDHSATEVASNGTMAFLRMLAAQGVSADLGIFDPPYSPRQISEVYKSIGLKVGMTETQNGHLYKRCRDALDAIMKPGGIVLSFGWQSAGMGKGRGYERLEIALINHGGGHNDTICVAERKGPTSIRDRTGD